MVENNLNIEKQKYLFKLSMLEQQANQLEEKMKIVEQQTNEMEILKSSLEALKKSKEKEILASLGKGIFLKTEIKDKELLIDVGSKTILKKGIPETVKIIEFQIKELSKLKGEILKRINETNIELEKTIFSVKSEEGKDDETTGDEEIEIGKIFGKDKDIDTKKLDERKLASVDESD